MDNRSPRLERGYRIEGPSRTRSYSRSRSPPQRYRRRRQRRRPTLFDVRPEGVKFSGNAQRGATAAVPSRDQPERVQQQNEINMQSRHARRIYVGNLPYGVGRREIDTFFQELVSIALVLPSDNVGTHTIINTYFNQERKYSFVEFSSVELTNAALELNGALFKGKELIVKRPTDYKADIAPKPNCTLSWDLKKMPATFQKKLVRTGDSGVASSYPPGSIERLKHTQINNGPHKIYIAGFPLHLQDEQIRELLESFGKLRALHVPIGANGKKKGFGFCEYEDHNLTAAACAGLNGLEVGGNILQMRVAKAGAADTGAATGANTLPIGDRPAAMMAHQPTRFVKLGSMVTEADINDPQEYEDIKEDVRGMAMSFGSLQNILIPKSGPSLGCVFLEYGSSSDALRAANGMRGKVFDGRLVTADFVNEEVYAGEGNQ